MKFSDLALSGPFGLAFNRFYGSQTTGDPALGYGNWLHTYSARLDVSAQYAGAVVYYDAQGSPYNFAGVSNTNAAFDSMSGMTLTLSTDNSAYTLTSFSNEIWTFNAKGELMSLRDRNGNQQTVTRDTTSGHADRIVSVIDPLARKLCFYYESHNRITAVAAWMQNTACPGSAPASSVTTPVVTMTYDIGTNCAYGRLCAVTEPDGGTWTYQFADPYRGSNHKGARSARRPRGD